MEADFHGRKRSGNVHAFSIDPEAGLYRKGASAIPRGARATSLIALLDPIRAWAARVAAKGAR